MRWTSFVCTLLPTAFANVEKVVFRAPRTIAIPHSLLNLEHSCLRTLTPSQPVLNTHIGVRFPTEAEPRGTESWYLLEDLSAGQRHELRICWAAIQPTEFWLEVFTFDEVFKTPSLTVSLAGYSEQQQGHASCGSRAPLDLDAAVKNNRALLFLRLQSAADFFSTNTTLMRDPPNVHVDIILDPYVFNILPRSLGPTAFFLIVLAFVSWGLSGYIWGFLNTPLRMNTKTHTT